MSNKKSASRKLKYFLLYVFISIVAVNIYNNITHNSNAGVSNATHNINSALTFMFNAFVILLSGLVVWVTILVFYVIITTRKRSCIPRSVYSIYNERKSHGRELLRKGLTETFDPNTPIPESIECVKFAFLYCDRTLVYPRIVIRPILVRDEFFPTYKPGRNTARCIGGKLDKIHKSPHEDCTCGFYALKSYDELLYSTDNVRTTIPLPSLALLNCSLQGKIIEASNGYRAEQLIIESLKICSYCLICSKSRAKKVTYAEGIGVYSSEKRGIEISLKNYLIPLCHKHLRECDIRFSLQQLREALQLDVDWYEINPLEN